MTDAKTIREDAVRERNEAQIRAGMELSEDIRHARQRYEEALRDSERVYKLRTGNLPEGASQ